MSNRRTITIVESNGLFFAEYQGKRLPLPGRGHKWSGNVLRACTRAGFRWYQTAERNRWELRQLEQHERCNQFNPSSHERVAAFFAACDAEQAEQEAARVAAEHADISAQVRRYGRRTVYLTARHVSPSYCFQAEPVTVSATVQSDRNGLPVVRYYADHAKLGCGKDAKSPADAVLSLARDHGCNWIEVRDENGEFVSHIPPLTPMQEEIAARNAAAVQAEQLEQAEEIRGINDQATQSLINAEEEEQAEPVQADNVRRPASLGAMANPFHLEPVQAIRIRRPVPSVVPAVPSVSFRSHADALAVISLSLRCSYAADLTPAEIRTMNRLASRAASCIRRNNPAARLWLGQMRAFFRRCMDNPRTIRAAA